MLYQSASDWRAAPHKRLSFFGMSGLGKTHLSNMLRAQGEWFHYSIDYRIGTAYMGEHIVDNLKREAMKVPFLAKLLKGDGIYIGSNITFDNLSPLASYLGKPGDAAKGGLPYPEYARRQALHHRAEVNALMDTPHFIDRAGELYGYSHFVCDTGGSICEVVDPNDPADNVLSELCQHTLMVWIEGAPDHTQMLVDRFRADPKPMCYRMSFLEENWDAFLAAHGVAPDAVDPDAFMLATYAKAIEARHGRYAAIAKNWGIKVQADDVARCKSADDVVDLIADGLAAHRADHS